MADYRITIAGDSAFNLEFATTISEQTSNLVRAAADALKADPIVGVVELVPTFCSLMVCYDPGVITFKEATDLIRSKLGGISSERSQIKRIVKVPVCYGGDYGPDMDTVMNHSGLSEEEVISIHSAHDYLIDMLGFLPGFAYLGGLDPRLHTPRLTVPRTVIEAGSVGIGGTQTGVYPLASPGGWQLIGRTPIKTYDPTREEPILYAAGDYLRFVPISESEFVRIEASVADGTWVPDIIWEE